jgi:hypothetical protein
MLMPNPMSIVELVLSASLCATATLCAACRCCSLAAAFDARRSSPAIASALRRHSPVLKRASQIDGLVALGRAPEVEDEVETLLLSPYLEPFALRALAVATDDQELLERALDRFTALGLHWHAAQTPLLSSVRH